MNQQTFRVKAAAVSAAVAFFTFFLSGCSLFRQADGVGRNDVGKKPVQSADIGKDSDTSSDTFPFTTDSSATNNPSDTKPDEVEKRASIVAVGDNIIHEAVFLDAKNRASDGAEYDFLPMYNGVADEIAAADLAFINHETPLAGKEYGYSGYPTFNAPREAAEALVSVGFDVINLANNHILDKRVSGARATVEYVQSLSVTEIGVYLDQADYNNIRVTEVNGIRIAWVAFCYGSNNPYNPSSDNIVMPLLDDDSAIRSQIAAAREVADFVIVSAHWGGDDQAAVTSEERRLAKVMADAGADVILGHHPHILQPVEWCERSDGGQTLVVYSLGNFLSTQHYARNMIGGMIMFDIVMDDDGACTIENPVLYPTVTHYSMNRDGLQLYMLEDYTEQLAAAHGCKLYTTDFSLDWIDKHVRAIVDEEFLPAFFDK